MTDPSLSSSAAPDDRWQPANGAGQESTRFRPDLSGPYSRAPVSRHLPEQAKEQSMTTSNSLNSSSERPVILIHGIATNTDALWRKAGWVDSLEAAGRTVIGVDLPGHGASKDAVDRDAADLVLEAAAEHGSVDAIGFSVGAWALLLAASEQPAAFERIAILGAADMVLTGGMQAEAMQRPLIAALRSTEEPAGNPMAMMLRAMIADAGNDRDSVAGYLAADKRFATVEGLSGITASTLIIEGGSDVAGPSDLVSRAIPNSERVVIAGVDHFEIPANAQCKSVVESFVNRPRDRYGRRG
jgi:pimeloyl-ACP methyl ester carboxylesterase